LKRSLSDLGRVVAWLLGFGMVGIAPGFNRTRAVVNRFSI
jgi:hypothetical protein